MGVVGGLLDSLDPSKNFVHFLENVPKDQSIPNSTFFLEGRDGFRKGVREVKTPLDKGLKAWVATPHRFKSEKSLSSQVPIVIQKGLEGTVVRVSSGEVDNIRLRVVRNPLVIGQAPI